VFSNQKRTYLTTKSKKIKKFYLLCPQQLNPVNPVKNKPFFASNAHIRAFIEGRPFFCRRPKRRKWRMVNIQKNNHLSIINNHCALGTTSTFVVSALQISSFMQNKSNSNPF